MAKPFRQLPGIIFFVTTNLERRYENLFQKRKYALIVRDCIFGFCAEMRYSVYAWVVMPDHAHIVIYPTGDKNMSQIMNRIKGVASRKINLIRKSKGILWQEGYHDEIIRDEKQMLTTIDYIHNNPVKANLVSTPEEYEFSSCRDYIQGSADYSWRE
jgi:REP element-mobilizing transposase RayT